MTEQVKQQNHVFICTVHAYAAKLIKTRKTPALKSENEHVAIE
jgi:hypothetical protein